MSTYLTLALLELLQKSEDLVRFFFYLGFTPCTAEQPVQGMELLTWKRSINRLKHTGKLFRGLHLYAGKRETIEIKIKKHGKIQQNHVICSKRKTNDTFLILL